MNWLEKQKENPQRPSGLLRVIQYKNLKNLFLYNHIMRSAFNDTYG